MPHIGVHGATPFHMPSNHQTAYNHSFRDEVPYNIRAQVRIKCSSCGCWAKRGALCYLCKQPVGGYVLPRHNNVKVIPAGDSTFSAGQLGGRSNSAHSRSPRRRSNTPTDKKRTASAPRPAASPVPAVGQPRGRTSRPTTAPAPLTVQHKSALEHVFRDTSGNNPISHTKIKCRSCGCWVTKGKPCSLCRTISR